jgi:formylglycine-generating enzyme required for sulfatase activity
MSLCLACGAANPLDTKFCSQCRTRLLIQDRYRALRIIGQGGFGKTFLAQDEGKPSKPKCVIKQFIYDDPATLREAQRLFEQEAVRLDDLGRHPQIPELLAHCEQEGRQYLVQEFIDGENLLQELKRSGRFSEVKIKDLLLDLLPVLQFIHAGQVIHRDIKPENIIRRRSDGRLVLVDFGAAKVATKSALQKTATTIGSPEYTAPEQAKGKPVYPSDIYALGVTCIYLLTQISPFDLFSDSEFQWVWRQYLNGITVNDKLGRVLDKMLEQALVRRYQTIDDVLQDLDLPKKSPISTPVLSQPIPSVAQSPSSKPSFLSGLFPQPAQTITTSSSSLVLDCGNGVKLELVRIPEGKFMMGSEEKSDRQPIHEVALQEFWMGKYAVTQKQWQSLMGNNPAHFKGKNLPIENVSWYDVMEFCEKVSQNSGKKIRLPTEAEWEYACRAGTTTPFHFGDIITADLGNHIYGVLLKGKYRHETVDVDSFYPNQWGLYQMHGNVSEFCLDNWHNDYSIKPVRFKQNGNEPWLDKINKSSNPYHVVRGGAWNNKALNCTSASRQICYAEHGCKDIGFRLALSNVES